MTLEADLYAGVKGQAAIAAVLGGAGEPRWFYGKAPQGLEPALPYVTALLSYPAGTQHMLGVSAIEEPVLSADVWCDDPDRAMALGRLIDGWLQGFRGILGSTNVRRIFRQSLVPLPELRRDGSERQTFRVRGEWRIVYAS